MHETHDGVQDMACDTFIKIAQKCRRHFIQVWLLSLPDSLTLSHSLSLSLSLTPSLTWSLSLLVVLSFLVQLQPLEVMPFIEEILNNIRAIICDLQPHHVHTFYEAVGYMIQAQVVCWISTLYYVIFNTRKRERRESVRMREKERERQHRQTDTCRERYSTLMIFLPASTGQCCSRKTDRQVHVPPQRNLGQHHPESDSCEWTSAKGQGSTLAHWLHTILVHRIQHCWSSLWQPALPPSPPGLLQFYLVFYSFVVGT